VTFDVTADAYARFMGRYSEPLAVQFAELAGAQAGHRALDVGCGPGALTTQLVERLGAEAVSAIDPSPSFVAAIRARFPEVDVQSGVAEHLPFPDDCFDLALAQLVVHFMTDAVSGLLEMARVTRPGGLVAVCVWDHAGDRSPLSTFWRAVRDNDPGARDEAELAGAREGSFDGTVRSGRLDQHRANDAYRQSALRHVRRLVGALHDWVSDLRVPTSPSWMIGGAMSCGPNARIYCHRRRSRSQLQPGACVLAPNV